MLNEGYLFHIPVYRDMTCPWNPLPKKKKKQQQQLTYEVIFFRHPP